MYNLLNISFCIECQCNATGSNNNICDHTTGKCNCRENVNGSQCDSCNVSSRNLMKIVNNIYVIIVC